MQRPKPRKEHGHQHERERCRHERPEHGDEQAREHEPQRHGRALAAGATEHEITSVLLAVAPAAGLGRVAATVPDVAAALRYDIEAALLEHPR